MRSTTIYDVAREAGVSVATVSRVMNTPRRVAPATRENVLRVVDRLGFVPKADAVSRARRGVGRIGVVGPFTSHPAAQRRLAGILAAARPDLEVVVYDHESAASSLTPLLATLPATGHLDGLVVMSLPVDPATAGRLREKGYPVVLLDAEDDGLTSIVVDDEGGGRAVARHLVELGHRRIGFVGEAQRAGERDSPARRRLEGFRDELARRGVALPEDAVRQATPRTRQAITEVLGLLRAADRPTAVFASDDLLAASVLRAAGGLGIAVPEQLSVVGFDDGELAEIIGLTTVRQPLERSGALAVRLMRGLLGGGDDPTRMLLRVGVTSRSTTAPPG